MNIYSGVRYQHAAQIRVTLRGFINYVFAAEHYPQFLQTVSKTIADELENAPAAFIGTLEGTQFRQGARPSGIMSPHIHRPTTDRPGNDVGTPIVQELGLVKRHVSTADRRTREAILTRKGMAATGTLDRGPARQPGRSIDTHNAHPPPFRFCEQRIATLCAGNRRATKVIVDRTRKER